MSTMTSEFREVLQALINRMVNCGAIVTLTPIEVHGQYGVAIVGYTVRITKAAGINSAEEMPMDYAVKVMQDWLAKHEKTDTVVTHESSTPADPDAPIPDNEAIYDAEIAPALLALGKRCQSLGMPFLAVVEFGPDDTGMTGMVPANACIPMQLALRGAASRGNFDGMAISFLKWLRERGISAKASMFLGRHS